LKSINKVIAVMAHLKSTIY